LLIEAIDELVDGTKGAAFPLIRADLHLSYTQVGLLIAVPLLVGGLIELPLGILAGYGSRRNQLVLVGGVAFAASLCVVAFAGSFGVLLVGLVAFFPASGAFVGLTQAALMDVGLPVDQTRLASQQGEGSQQRREVVQQRRMAAWNLAGSAGAVAGPILLAVVLTVGGSWRWAYLLLAGLTGVAIAIAAVGGPARFASSSSATDQPDGAEPASDLEPASGAEEASGTEPVDEPAEDDEDDEERPTLREALAAVRDGNVARWLVLLEVIDLLLDVLTGYVGIYLVDVVHASPADAALGVAVRLGAGLAGDALFVVASNRISGRTALTVSALAAAVLYPAFLLVPWFGAKLAVLAVLSAATACWYPVVQAGVYASLPGRSGIAVSWSSAAGMVGAVGPLVVGLVAQRAGLTWALAGLVVVPVAVLVIVPRSADRRSRRVMR
jgi:FSR family fosmidomycin resistance protein-like MFS transporter